MYKAFLSSLKRSKQPISVAWHSLTQRDVRSGWTASVATGDGDFWSEKGRVTRVVFCEWAHTMSSRGARTARGALSRAFRYWYLSPCHSLDLLLTFSRLIASSCPWIYPYYSASVALCSHASWLVSSDSWYASSFQPLSWKRRSITSEMGFSPGHHMGSPTR